MLSNDRACKPIAACRKLASAVVIGIAALLCGAAPGRAQDPVVLAQEHLYAGTLAAAKRRLPPVPRSPGNDNARFGLAGVSSCALSSGWHSPCIVTASRPREPPRADAAPAGAAQPPSGAPHLDGFRAILQQFVDDLARADATLGEAGSPT